MKSLKNISVFRIAIFLVLSYLINNIIFTILLAIILFFYNHYETILYILLLLFITIVNNNCADFIKYGIVEKKINNYYVVDKLLYKTKTYSDEISVGNIVTTYNSAKINDKNILKKNIIFENDCKVITNLSIRSFIYNKINSFEDNTKTSLEKFIYNINDYDDQSLNLGYGLAIYLLIKSIYKKNKKISLITMLMYILFFRNEIKFSLILIDYCLSYLKTNKIDSLGIKIIIILLLNSYYLYNVSLLLPILYDLYNTFDYKIRFKSYFAILQSLLFGNINVLSIFTYKYICLYQIFLFILSLVLLFMPNLNCFYLFFVKIYSFINNLNINIRGAVSIISIFFFYILKSIFNNESDFIELTIIILLVISPFNNPFMKISFIDVGQGDSILIKSSFNKSNVLIDTGSKYNYYKLKKYLFSQGIYKIDYLIITHNDSDHNGNIENLKNDFKINEIIFEGKDIDNIDIYLKYLYIDDFNNDNDNSLVYYTNINNIGFIFTGDISSKAERKMVNEYGYLDIDVLKVSHHGSNTGSSEYFISNYLPKISIISTSGMYGHPSSITLDTLKQYMCPYYITKQLGNIEIYLLNCVNILKTSRFDFVIIR